MNNITWLNEVETKVLDTPEASMLSKMQALGFTPYFSGELKAQWLINPANGEKLRVRQEGDIIMIEHKSSSGKSSAGVKSLEELWFEAKDFDRAIAVLMRVGLEKQGLVSVKWRVSHVLNYDDPVRRARLDFDTYASLGGKPIPEFVEVEATSEDRLWEIVDKLGIDRSRCMNYGPKELFKHYYPDDPFV